MTGVVRSAVRSLSRRVVAAFVGTIVVTAVAFGIPAYHLIHAGLGHQAWAHVADGGRATLALLDAEKGRLSDMAALTAHRPTLQRLLREGDAAALDGYLRAFQANVDLDILVVRDASGEALAGGRWADLPFEEETVFYPLSRSTSGPALALALIDSHAINDVESGDLLGYVTVGILLDDAFARHLADETGFGQSIVMEDQRVATSLPASQVVETAAAGQAETLPPGEARTLKVGRNAYYTVLHPLLDPQGHEIARIEVALPVDDLLRAERRALAGLALAALLIAAIGSTSGGLYVRQLTAPLRQLTLAARNISRGDLITPVPVPREPDEIATLAQALEESRVNTFRALDDLSQARAWLDTLIQSVAEGIVTVDQEGRITSFSQGAARITGWPREAALGQPLDGVLRPAEGAEPLSKKALSSGTMRQVGVVTAGGRPATLAVTGARLKPPDGGTRQTVLVFRDMTEEEAIGRLRAYFLANISHEFRTPLSALHASVELLMEEMGALSRAEVWELLNSVQRSVAGLQALIDNLLESSRIEAGRFSIRRRPSDLNAIIADAVHMTRPLLERRCQELAVSEPPHPPTIDADPTRLTQVLVNLLSNASKYSPVGAPVELSVEVEDDRLRMVVADRGPGIPPAEQSSLFQRFVRLDAQDGTQYGVGLGLSVVKAIVEEHGGKVGVEARPEGGSAFWLTLPLEGMVVQETVVQETVVKVTDDENTDS
ncbi:MAG: ATP-binding protein [Chloroflexota bacterium]